MSGRPKKTRNITFAPSVLGFKPYGMTSSRKKEPVFLHYEEYETLRLCDYENHTQQEAASLMNVSRPTLTRIYSSARAKIAQGFIEGRQIIVEGGKVNFDKEWFMCDSCKCYFTFPFPDKELPDECPLCKSSLLQNFEEKKQILISDPVAGLRKPAKIAITSTGSDIQSSLDNHFGRCSYFGILTTESNTIDFVRNPYKNRDGKTGILAAELMKEHQVEKVISGDFGVKVKPKLIQLGIQMIIFKKENLSIQNIVQLLHPAI